MNAAGILPTRQTLALATHGWMIVTLNSVDCKLVPCACAVEVIGQGRR